MSTKLAIDPSFRQTLENHWAHRQSCYAIAFPRPMNKPRLTEWPTPELVVQPITDTSTGINQPIQSSWSIWQLPSLWWYGSPEPSKT